MNTQLAEIKWPQKPILKDQHLFRKNKEIIYFLCEHGVIIEWLDGELGKDTYEHMPYKYQMKNSDQIEFLPHWGGIKINGEWLQGTDTMPILTEKYTE